jgi:hypothetical protein
VRVHIRTGVGGLDKICTLNCTMAVRIELNFSVVDRNLLDIVVVQVYLMIQDVRI